MPRFRVGGALALVVLAFAAGGCATFRGAPEPMVSRRQVNGDAILKADDEVRALLSPESYQARNASQMRLMALADLRYAQYRNDLVNNRRGTGAGSGVLTLLADIAATLTDSVGVKNNYIALSALVGGSEAVFDKEYLFDKTIDSLIARMDADRKAKQVEIYTRHEDDVERYTGHSALADVIEYYSLGTLNAGLVSVNKSVQAKAEAEQNSSEETLKRLVSPQAVANGEATMRMSRFVASLNDDDMEGLRDFLRDKNIGVPQESSDSNKRVALRKGLVEFRTMQREQGKSDEQAEDDTVLELQAAGFLVPD